ncbi:bifunctional DNA primase/polymerase [Streptantibioticus rubrisoli]|uniref:Bifunctional DNA primase/polymerase n=1 Tax=Streptantibioticus rubrisoli TaxID=1387313 RepID=A0ABT1PPF9_9ACTN|nr:bifunctional DNA primase/polymerase [Streptantibioticus rubrisoli]MCQ4046681.1 bifunctional DNA primase/polymerase [Streptantibioticus rubrisoli]
MTDTWEPDAMLRAEYVTVAGADWLASASAFPRSVHALWAARPTAPSVLPCGTAFDVVNLPALFGRRVLDRLWAAGPGCGPVAVHRGRILVFAVPGTAARLPALLAWEEWGAHVPPLMCHGPGETVTVPPLVPVCDGRHSAGRSRWLVAPGARHPWLPGAPVLLWACLRAAQEGRDEG